MSEPPARAVVDSSVAVKWFVAERELHVGDAWTLLEGHQASTRILAAPTHLRLEVLSALKKRGLSASELARVADTLEGFALEWHEIDEAITQSAAPLAVQHGLTVYDAAFVALALDLDVELTTADRRLAASGACRVRLLGEE